MFGVIGFAFGLLFSTSRFALRNVIRAAAFGLVGYLVYELVTGYAQARARAQDEAATDAAFGRAVRGGRATQPLSASPLTAATHAEAAADTAARTSTGRSPAHGGGAQGMDLEDVVEGTPARVGRGVIHR